MWTQVRRKRKSFISNKSDKKFQWNLNRRVFLEFSSLFVHSSFKELNREDQKKIFSHASFILFFMKFNEILFRHNIFNIKLIKKIAQILDYNQCRSTMRILQLGIFSIFFTYHSNNKQSKIFNSCIICKQSMKIFSRVSRSERWEATKSFQWKIS